MENRRQKREDIYCIDEEDRAFLTKLFQKYHPTWRYIAAAVLKDSFLIEDAVQDAFKRIIPKISLFREAGMKACVPYMRRVVLTAAQDLRRKTSRLVPTAAEALETLEDMQLDTTDSIETDILFHQTLAKLPSRKERLLILYRVKYGWDYDQIALALDTNKDVARALFSRAKKHYQQIWREEVAHGKD